MSDHLPFNALRAFEAAARHLSFKAAAEELFVTPAAISQQIKFLEDTLDVKLFHRYNRKIELTKEAERGIPKIIEGFEALSEAVKLIKEDQPDTALTVWSSPSFAAKWLLPKLPQFRAAHPDIDLNISASLRMIDDGKGQQNSIPADNFRRDDIDVAIRFGQGEYPGCRVDKLFEVSAIPLCSPALLKGDKPLKVPADLSHFTLLHDDTPYEGRPTWSDWFEAAGIEDVNTEHGISFNSVSLALAAAIDGQGIAYTLRALAEDDISAGRLITPFELSMPMQQAYYVISLEETSEQGKIADFRDWLLSMT